MSLATTAAATAAPAPRAIRTVSRSSARPGFGNRSGHFPVPPAGRAVNTSHPNRVIGHGTPASCTSAAVVSAVAAGGIIRFNCGKKPVIIDMTATAVVPKTRHLVVLDGRGLVTLSGRGKRRILFSDTCAGTWSTDDCVNQPYPQIVVQNLTFTGGYNGTHQATCTANTPKCWYGGVDGGGAIFYVVDSGWGKLTLNESHLHHDPSAGFQTFPGIYDDIDGRDGPPVMINSTDS